MDRDLLESEGAKQFALAFVDMIITWNCVEAEARNLLLNTSHGGLGIFAAVTSLGNVALSNAILADAEYLDQPASEHLEHFAECMDRQRSYRNHYVHGISLLGRSMDGQNAGAMLISVEAKPRLRHIQEAVSRERITEFAAELEELRLYGARLNTKLRHRFHKLSALVEPEPPTWPEKPPLPVKLKKTRTRLPGLPPPPESSQA
jgi:hypothetical protein